MILFEYEDGSVAAYKNNPSFRRDCFLEGLEVLLLAALLLCLLGLLFLCHINILIEWLSSTRTYAVTRRCDYYFIIALMYAHDAFHARECG